MTNITVAIAANTPEVGESNFTSAILSCGLAIVILGGYMRWVGLSAAFDIMSPQFNPTLPFLALVIGAIGLAYTFTATVHTLRVRKVGSPILAVGELHLGGVTKGLVRTSCDLKPLGAFEFHLHFDARGSSRGIKRGGRINHTACLWESVHTASANARSTNSVSVDIPIPANGLSSASRSRGSDGERITWALEVRASFHGLEFYAEFPLKVMGLSRERADALADLSESESANTTRNMRAEPFAGYVKRRSKTTNFLLYVLLGAGAFFTSMAAFAIWKQISLSPNGTRAAAKDIPRSQSKIDVAISNSGTPPVVAHFLTSSNLHRWEAGMAVQFAYMEVATEARGCMMDIWLERRVNSMSGLLVGLVLLWAALRMDLQANPRRGQLYRLHEPFREGRGFISKLTTTGTGAVFKPLMHQTPHQF